MKSNNRIIEPVEAPGRQHGFGMVTAIFLLVVLAGLAVAMVTLSTTQQSSSALDVQGARAYQAARAGIEWGLYQRLIAGTACGTASAPVSTSIQLPAGESLSSFGLTVTCIQTATSPVNRYQITSTACNQPKAGGNFCPNPGTNLDYVQRVVQVEF